MTGAGATPQLAFDYIDPQMYPCSKTIPIGSTGVGHSGFGAGAWRTPLNASSFIVETWQEFTIRRVMCPSVPWKCITALQNRINGLQAWTPANMTVTGVPGNTFALGTLRLDSAEPIRRVVPTCVDGNGKYLLGADVAVPITAPVEWWDILYKFSWHTTWALWFDTIGNLQPFSQLSWNCDWADNMMTIRQPLSGWAQGSCATYDANGNIVTRYKYLNAEDDDIKPVFAGLAIGHPFDALFLLNAP